MVFFEKQFRYGLHLLRKGGLVNIKLIVFSCWFDPRLNLQLVNRVRCILFFTVIRLMYFFICLFLVLIHRDPTRFHNYSLEKIKIYFYSIGHFDFLIMLKVFFVFVFWQTNLKFKKIKNFKNSFWKDAFCTWNTIRF